MRKALGVLSAVIACTALGGCEGCGTSAEASQAGPTAAPAAAASTSGRKAHRHESPAPEITLEAEPTELGRPGQRVPVIRARGGAPSELSREVRVERRSGDHWAEVATVALRDSCDTPEEQGCVTLVPGAELRPPPWLGTRGHAQCECKGCAPAPEGTYRFVAQSCDGTHTLPGAPFESTR